jgi:hypothetical protein
LRLQDAEFLVHLSHHRILVVVGDAAKVGDRCHMGNAQATLAKVCINLPSCLGMLGLGRAHLTLLKV